MKDKDLKIIRAIRNNSRAGLKDISKETGIPITTVHTRMKFIQDCVIRNFSLLRYERLGHPIRVIYSIRIDNKEIVEKTLKSTFVNNAFRASGSIIVDCIFRDMKEESDFSEEMRDKNIIKDQYRIIEIEKEERFFT